LEYDLLIIGTTVAALGLAETAGKDLKILIADQTEMVAYEYVNSFKLPSVYSESAAYYKIFHDLNADILLNCEITNISYNRGSYLIEIFSGTEYRTFEAKRIADTRSKEENITAKSLNCLIVNKNKDEAVEILSDKFNHDAFKEVTFIPETDENLGIMIMKVSCPLEMSLPEARHKLIELWLKRPESLRKWKIAAIGQCFDTKAKFPYCEKNENYFLLPSDYYITPEESYEAGVQLGRRLLA
jgi:hypothetical protein